MVLYLPCCTQTECAHEAEQPDAALHQDAAALDLDLLRCRGNTDALGTYRGDLTLLVAAHISASVQSVAEMPSSSHRGLNTDPCVYSVKPVRLIVLLLF